MFDTPILHHTQRLAEGKPSYMHRMFPPGTPVHIDESIRTIHLLHPLAGKDAIACWSRDSVGAHGHSCVPVCVPGEDRIWYIEEAYVQTCQQGGAHEPH